MTGQDAAKPASMKTALKILSYMDLCVAQAVQAERERIKTLIRKRLVYDSQRAVSWHEIQDCLEAIGPASAPEGTK